MEKGIEVNSLSLQSTDLKRPSELIIPNTVTSIMLENSQKALELLNENIPDVDKGISLHASSVLNIDQVAESTIPITSVDTPDLAYPKEFLTTFIDRPTDLLNHLAWRLNSAIGWTEKKANEKRVHMLKKTEGLKPFSDKPFVRISLDSDVHKFENLIKHIPSNYILAIEYNAESGFSVDKYLEYVKNLNKSNPNIGLSIDPAHLFEYYLINQNEEYPEESTMNILENMFNENEQSPILSVDINNLNKGTNTYGKTHQVFSQGVLDLNPVIDSYKRYIKRNSKDGRVVIEFSPKDLSLFLDSNRNSALMSTIKRFS